jgi:uncharacterized protein (TIGR02599 family)
VTNDAVSMFQNLGTAANFSGDGLIFEAPLGYTNNVTYRPLYNALCARGYFVLFGDDRKSLPSGLASRLNPRFRFRLYEIRQATEDNRAYGNTLGTPSTQFMNFDQTTDTIQPIADNIVGIVFLPIFGGNAGAAGIVPASAYALDKQLNPNQAMFSFDSLTEADPARKGKLPRALRCIAFAIDEESAERLTQANGNGVPRELNAVVSAFKSVASVDRDINDLQQRMDQQRINFRAFTATIPILAGQW